jgi:IS1 family transposase
VSLRGLERIYDVSRQRIAKWIKEHVQGLPDLKDTLIPAQGNDVLEYDEAWSFVLKKANKRWLWTVMCRRTRQILAFVIGDRSKDTCRLLWCRIPIEYRSCISYSDFWEAYQQVLPKDTHFSVGKESGETAHMERWYCTLRQRQARFVRRTLSFSKSDAYHHMVTKWYIVEHNLMIKDLLSSLTL